VAGFESEVFFRVVVQSVHGESDVILGARRKAYLLQGERAEQPAAGSARLRYRWQFALRRTPMYAHADASEHVEQQGGFAVAYRGSGVLFARQKDLEDAIMKLASGKCQGHFKAARFLRRRLGNHKIESIHQPD
jgi:hypothetical protein